MKTLFTPISCSHWCSSVTCNESNFVTLYEVIKIKTHFNSGISYSCKSGQKTLTSYELDFKEKPQDYEWLYEEITRRLELKRYKYFLIQFANGLELIVSSAEELKNLLKYVEEWTYEECYTRRYQYELLELLEFLQSKQ
jgi:hypothetical protein